jgi:hypothetical protein
MGTPASIQHANLIAFSATAVKAGARLLLRCDGYAPIHLHASHGVLAALCDTLGKLGFSPPAAPPAIPALPELEKGRRGPRMSEVRLASYRRVAAAVASGARWRDAAHAAGVDPQKVNAWWHAAQKRLARRTGAAPVLKPSGDIL